MASFEENIQKVKTARYGEEVRGAISEGLQQAHNVNSAANNNILHSWISTTNPVTGNPWTSNPNEASGIGFDLGNNKIKNFGTWYVWDPYSDISGYRRVDSANDSWRTPSCGSLEFAQGSVYYVYVSRSTGLVDISHPLIDSTDEYILLGCIYGGHWYGFSGDISSFYITSINIDDTNKGYHRTVPLTYYMNYSGSNLKEEITTIYSNPMLTRAGIRKDGSVQYLEGIVDKFYISQPFKVCPGDILLCAENIVPLGSDYLNIAIYDSDGKFLVGRNSNETKFYTPFVVPDKGSYCLTADANLSDYTSSFIINRVHRYNNPTKDYDDGFRFVRLKSNWDKAIRENGTIDKLSDGRWVLSQKINVRGVRSVYVYGVGNALGPGHVPFAFYDKDKNFIEIELAKDSNDKLYNKYWVDVPENAEYLLVSDVRTNSDTPYDENGLWGSYVILFGMRGDETTLIPPFPEIPSNSFTDYKDYDKDIALPSAINVMADHEFDVYYDTLSRYDCSSNLFKIKVNGKDTPTVKRNAMCFSWTPSDSDSDTVMTIERRNPLDFSVSETKQVSLKVNKKVSSHLTKGILIIGDSITDDNYTAKEVYDLLRADGDITVNMIGTRGPSDGKHEAHSGWNWDSFIAKNSSNPFYDSDSGTINIKKYCSKHGFANVDYFLANLGTNHISQGENAYTSVDQLQHPVDSAKKFLTYLLDETTGFPNCKVALALIPTGAEYFFRAYWSSEVFKMSANTLNHAYLEAFDNGAWKPNVTMMALGSFLNRRYAFPHTESPISSRFSETCITYTDHVHPDARGRRSLADAYYNQIRGWMTEDAS